MKQDSDTLYMLSIPLPYGISNFLHGEGMDNFLNYMIEEIVHKQPKWWF